MDRPLHLLDLVSIEKLEAVIGAFTSATGVAAIIAHTDGSPITQPSNFTPFCLNYCRSTDEGRKRCHESDRYGGAVSARTRKPYIYKCLNAGLIDSAAPVIVEGYHLATVLCGQVLEGPLDRDRALERAAAIGIEDYDGYLNELARIPLMSRQRLHAVVHLMAVITQTISELALQKYLSHKRSRQYLHRLINSVSDCIFSTNAENIISMINDAGARMFGCEPESLIGESILSLLAGEESRRRYLEQVQSRPNRSWRAELKAVSRQGDEFPVHLTISGINGRGEINEGYVGVIRDISEEKRIERMKQDLIGMLTHDMKNPVLSVQKALQLLLGETLGSVNRSQRDILSMALAATYDVYGMINDLLDIYRHENGKFFLYRSQVNLIRILQDSFNQVQFIAREKRIHLNMESCSDDITLNADLNRLIRTWVNLLDNAIKYSPEGSIVRVACLLFRGSDREAVQTIVPKPKRDKCRNDRQYVLITISDQGLGIPREYHERVFDNLFTINSRNLPGRKGVGLGLAFCRQVVEAHEGLIWLESPITTDRSGTPRGCRFYVALPVATH
ncbi:sensor histidine kinase [Desulfosoma sp.]